jgi:hypothetical protein
MSYLHDLNGAVYNVALTQSNVTTTTTGPAVDMVTGDGVCNLLLGTLAGNLTSLTAQVWQATASTGTYTTITGASCVATTASTTAVAFNRDSRYLQVVFALSGTGSTGVPAFLIEQKKNA